MITLPVNIHSTVNMFLLLNNNTEMTYNVLTMKIK